MGKKIDIFVLTFLAAACLYLYFWQTLGHPLVAIGAALLCTLVGAKTLRRIGARVWGSRYLKSQRYRRQADGLILELACIEIADARAQLSALFEKCFHAQYPIELIQAHPSANLSCNAVFNVWKRHRGDDHLVVCATCPCTADVRMMSAALSSPKIAIVDSERLKDLMAQYPQELKICASHGKLPAMRLRRLMRRIIDRKNAPRCILFAFSGMLMYVFSGNLLYLISAMSLFALALISFHRPSATARLF